MATENKRISLRLYYGVSPSESSPRGGQGFQASLAPILPTIAKNGKILQMSTSSTMNIALPDPLRAYVASRVESGQYGNTSEFVRDLIRKDQREQRVLRLRALLEEGLASGPASEDTAEERAEYRAIANGDLS